MYSTRIVVTFYYKLLIQIWGACPDYIIIYIKNMNLKVKKVAIVWRAAGIYNLMTLKTRYNPLAHCEKS
jgi:hypothetical protein